MAYGACKRHHTAHIMTVPSRLFLEIFLVIPPNKQHKLEDYSVICNKSRLPLLATLTPYWSDRRYTFGIRIFSQVVHQGA